VFWSRRFLLSLAIGAGAFGSLGVSAAAAVNPGWECVPVKAGRSVVSGGVGVKPKCAAGTTAVLAPTYIAAGVGGKPTVEFSTVNLQIVSGSGSTYGAPNGKGNLIVGYAENPAKLARTGSNDLVVGASNGWTGYGDLVGGTANRVSGPYAAALGVSNIASAPESIVAGGCDNRAGAGALPTSPCPTFAQAVLGGESNHAIGPESAVSGGETNDANGEFASALGGYANAAVGLGSSVTGGHDNTAAATESSISGGAQNATTGPVSSIAGGYYNRTTVDEASVLGGCSNVAGTGTATVNTGCSSFGDSFTAIVGGIGNQDTPLGSSILGGESNSIDSSEGGAIAGGQNIALSGATADVSVIGTQLFNP
jgi:hypothetical protein